MSYCLSAGRAYGFDIEIVKSPSTYSRTSQLSSPSSTISESSNSTVALSTRKPRTPRKRPNQTYNEAATLLSTACPNIFSAKHLRKISKCTTHQNYFFDELPELVLPFRVMENSGFLLHPPVLEKPNFRAEPVVVNSLEKTCLSPMEINSSPKRDSSSMEFCEEYQDDFDTESMLDEEIEEGIDSIMGNSSKESDSNSVDESNTIPYYNGLINTCYGYPMGLGFSGTFDFGFGVRNAVRALRNVDEGTNWWSFPTVEVANITSKPKKVQEEKKKKKKIDKPALELKCSESGHGNSIPTIAGAPEENSIQEINIRLNLKLNYEDVLNAWSDRGNPLPDEISGSESPGGNDVHARLAQIDLFSDNGGLREASVMRYKEKRRNRLFSKKIRYQVRKVNADRRPRMKGRFVRRPNSPMNEER